MEQKKQTAAQLQRRLDKAVLHIDRTKNVRSVYFSDKGMRLTDCDDVVIIATGYHQHVFYKMTVSGFSRPCLYASRFIDFALENDCTVKDDKGNVSYSYTKLINVLKEKKDRTEYNIAVYCDWWFSIIFAPLYALDENAASQFNVYFTYMNHIATQHIFLSEHKDGMTNKQFVDEHDKLMKQFLENITEAPIFEPLSDEQRMKQEMEAMKEQEVEQNVAS